MIDLHVHYLPGVDDGPETLAASVEMARQAVADGIRAATVTPHHLNGRYENSRSSILPALDGLRQALQEQAIPLTLLPGAEVHLVPELPAALAEGTVMTVADRGRAVLVEPPVHALPLGVEAILSECLEFGVTPIIAHPERCRALQSDAAPLRRWVEMGCLVQITAQSCTGRFGHAARRTAYTLIGQGLAHVLASDGHRPYGRVPCISQGRAVVAEWFSETVAGYMTERLPRSLLEGEPPDTAGLQAALAEGTGNEGGGRRWLGLTKN